MNSTLAEAKAIVGAGISVIPTAQNKTPASFLLPRDQDDPTKGVWKPFQERHATSAEILQWFEQPKAGIARVHGKISGNLETIDFDCGDEVVSEWEATVNDQAPGLLNRLTKIRTPRPGTQVCYRCIEPVDGNQKLAEVQGEGRNEWNTLIETRGEGGYAVCPGTLPCFHPANRPYEYVAGPTLAEVSTITADERRILLTAARMFNRRSEKTNPPAQRDHTRGQLRPGDDFNQRTTWAELLESRGWALVCQRGDVGYWKRPGGNSQWSATTNYAGNDLLHVFSTNTGLDPERSYSKFAVYAHLEHSDDFGAATKALASKGFGESLSRDRQHGAVMSRRGGDDGRKPLLELVNAANVEPEEVDWLWPGRIAVGKVNNCCGDPGLGKSFVTGAYIPACVSTGAAWPDGSGTAPVGDVLLLNAEDGIADTIVPRLITHGADRNRIAIIRGVSSIDPDTGDRVSRGLRFDIDLRQIEAHLDENPGVRLLVVDPISEYMGDVDSHKNAEVRTVLSRLGALAEKYRVAVVAVTHMNKSANGPALYRAMGSLAFVAQARTAWAFVRDAKNPERVLFLPLKNNLHKKVDGMAYQIVDGRVVWEPGSITMSADDAIRANVHAKGPDKLQQALEWIKKHLAGGPVESDQLDQAASTAGIAIGTLRRAKSQICNSYKEKGRRGRWIVQLGEQQESDAHIEHVEPLLFTAEEDAQGAQRPQDAQEPKEEEWILTSGS